ncbi:hypothetical protein PGT21_025356 [Puccinia graminis f. sp. tritici]|uniref:Uncharacterized protein n=1 Tax=Puccinia graminis f. sp. tritici TaxID=56615 RepID=A0A5B0N3F2_PUCGR|nr:hypothetical protein PGT21_025356 [Puccinia graminis f. sp. tritici]
MTRTRPGSLAGRVRAGVLIVGQSGRPEPGMQTADPNPKSPKTGSGLGSTYSSLTRPDPTRHRCRVGFGHCFWARTRPVYILNLGHSDRRVAGQDCCLVIFVEAGEKHDDDDEFPFAT